MKKIRTIKKSTGGDAAPFETYPIVWIKWLDAAHTQQVGWVNELSFQPPLLAAEACGYLVYEGSNQWGEELLTIASAIVYNQEGKPDFSEGFTIPKKMVLEVRILPRG